MTDPTKGEW